VFIVFGCNLTANLGTVIDLRIWSMVRFSSANSLVYNVLKSCGPCSFDLDALVFEPPGSGLMETNFGRLRKKRRKHRFFRIL
jgi:hypothetical protein